MAASIRARMHALLRHPIVPSFVRYATIGVGNAALNFATYAALTRGFVFWRTHYLLANLVTFVVVVTWSFYWNKRWSFRNHERRHAAQYTKFFLVTIGGIVIEQSALAFGTGTLGILDLLVKLLAAPMIVAWNFTMYRVWAFREERHAEDSHGEPALV